MKRRTILFGTALALLLTYVDRVPSQQQMPSPSRQNESIPAPQEGEAKFLSTMKEMRERAAARYNRNMRQFNQQIQQLQAAPSGPAQQAPKGAVSYKQPPRQPERQPHYSNNQNPLAILWQFFGSPENNSAKNGFPQKAQQQPYPQVSRQTPPPTAHQYDHSAVQKQQQARLIQQRMQVQAAVQQAQQNPRATTPLPKAPVRAEQRQEKSASRMPASSVDQLAKASTSRESASEVTSQIPWDVLPAAARKRAEAIISGYTFYRRLPMTGGYCNPEIYDFLVCHPEVVVGTWQASGFNKLSLSNDGNGHFSVHDDSGTHAEIEIIYHDNKMVVLLCSGTYEGQLAPRPIQGDILCVLQYRFTEDVANGNKPIAVSRLDTFVKMSSASTDLVGKAFAPMIGKVADSNFVKTVDSVNQISELTERNPRVVAEIIQGAQYVPQETKNAFLGYIERVTGHASMRDQGVEVEYYMLPKMNVAKTEPAMILSRRDRSSRNMASVAPRVAEAEERTGVVMPAPSLVTSMPTPSQLASNTASPKNVVANLATSTSSRGEDMPFPSASQRKSAVVNLNHKVSLPADGSQNPERDSKSVLSGGESLEEFNLNDDSQELVFSDDLTSTEPAMPQVASVSKSIDTEELCFDMDDEEQSSTLEVKEITTAEPNPETANGSNVGDGWTPVISKPAITKAAAAPAQTLTSVPEGQKCSWKKPEIR